MISYVVQKSSTFIPAWPSSLYNCAADWKWIPDNPRRLAASTYAGMSSMYTASSAHFAGPQRFPVNQCGRLAGADRAGVRAHCLRKILEEVIRSFELLHMDRICIRQQSQPVIFRQTSKEGSLVNRFRIQRRIPGF